MAMKPAALAGMLCNDPAFLRYLDAAKRARYALDLDQLPNGTHVADDAADFIRKACGVESRRDISSDATAQAMLQRIYQNFLAWRRIEMPMAQTQNHGDGND